MSKQVAEYKALILGLKYALKRGFSRIRMQGDSKLVYTQVFNYSSYRVSLLSVARF